MGTRSNVWKKHVSSKVHHDKHEQYLARPTVQTKLSVQVETTAQLTAQTERLATAVSNHRVRCARMALSTSISFNMLDKNEALRELLEEARPQRLQLGGRIASDTIGPICEAVTTEYKRLLAGRRILVSFDASPRLKDAAAVVFSICTDSFDIVEVIGAFKQFALPLNSTDWLNVIISAGERYDLQRKFFLFGNSDRGGPNKPTVMKLTAFWPSFTHSWCICHALNSVGNRVNFTAWKDFLKAWNRVFKNSLGAQAIFAAIAKERFKPKSQVKWWTQFEQSEQLFRVFPVIGDVLRHVKGRGFCKKTIDAALNLWQQHLSNGPASDLALAVAAMHDVFELFMRTCTFFEGAAFISPLVYQQIKRLTDLVEKILAAKETPDCLPNVVALLAKDAQVNSAEKWLLYVRPCLAPALKYYWALFVHLEPHGEEEGDDVKVSFKEAIDLFRFARLFDPLQGYQLLVDKEFKFPQWKQTVQQVVGDLWERLDLDLVQLIKVYTKWVSEHEGTQLDPRMLLEWWRVHGLEAGSWATAAQRFALLRPSSAVVERVFSVWQSAISKEMLGAHEMTQELRMQMNFQRFSEEW